MTTEALVSVIMPVYNGAGFIQPAIESVLGQSYSNLELLIINDGSLDDTEGIVLELMLRDTRIRYFKQENRGVASARNTGLRHMEGSYFCFLDSDDVFPPNSIAVRIRRLLADPQLSYCDGAVVICDENMNPTRRWQPRCTGIVFKKLVGINECCFFGPTWFIKRDFSASYVFSEKMTHAEDLFFFVGISRSGKYGFVEDDILFYRSRNNSAMKNLKGLANGYAVLYENVVARFSNEMSLVERVYLFLKIRKIMTLSFLANGNFKSAMFFLLMGKVE